MPRREPDPLPEQAIGHMVFRVVGGPFGGTTRPVYFKHGDRPRVGMKFGFAVAESVWKALVKKKGKAGVAEYEITKLPQERESGLMLNMDAGELKFCRLYGVLEA